MKKKGLNNRRPLYLSRQKLDDNRPGAPKSRYAIYASSVVLVTAKNIHTYTNIQQ